MRVARIMALAALLAACDAEPEADQLLQAAAPQGAHSAWAGADTDSYAGAEADVEADSATEVQADPDTEAEADSGTEVQADSGTDSGPEADSEADSEPETDSDTDSESDAGPEPGPATYVEGALHSPLTPWVVQNLLDIMAAGPQWQDDVFMKVGASGTVNANLLSCFAGPSEWIQLEEWAGLQPTIDFFAEGDAAGSTPFDRKTLAAKSGMSAIWAISGDPSPIEQEIDAIAPAFAMVHYGTNDMQLGLSYESAIWGFGKNLAELVDQLIDQGIVPIVSTIGPRQDAELAYRWVPTYNAVIRGVAQARQVPLYDMHLAVVDLPGQGLAGDKLHMNTYYSGGSARGCVFTEEGLEYGYNQRNLGLLQMLDRLRRALLEGEGALEPTLPSVEGLGTVDDPRVIAGAGALPFSDTQDTAASGPSLLDVYVGCGASQDESGGEVVYRLDVDEATPIRAMVFDGADTDIDLHLLSEAPTEEACAERHDRILEGTLTPGTWYFVLDTFVSASGGPQPGEYLFVLLTCEPDDPDCASAF